MAGRCPRAFGAATEHPAQAYPLCLVCDGLGVDGLRMGYPGEGGHTERRLLPTQAPSHPCGFLVLRPLCGRPPRDLAASSLLRPQRRSPSFLLLTNRFPSSRSRRSRQASFLGLPLRLCLAVALAAAAAPTWRPQPVLATRRKPSARHWRCAPSSTGAWFRDWARPVVRRGPSSFVGQRTSMVQPQRGMHGASCLRRSGWLHRWRLFSTKPHQTTQYQTSICQHTMAIVNFRRAYETQKLDARCAIVHEPQDASIHAAICCARRALVKVAADGRNALGAGTHLPLLHRWPQLRGSMRGLQLVSVFLDVRRGPTSFGGSAPGQNCPDNWCRGRCPRAAR